MLFALGPKVLKHCPNGHVMEKTWRKCPRCTGQPTREQVLDRDLNEATMIFGAQHSPTPVTPPRPDYLALLSVVAGPATGHELELRAGRWKLGRAPRAEPGLEPLAITDSAMSRDHFVLEAGVAAIVLRDLGSTNGTFVNGLRVERHILQEGDIVRAGETSLRVHLSIQPPS